MNKSPALKLILALGLLAGSVFLCAYFLRKGDNGISEQTFFYDLSEKKLFAASREALPPIKGLNNDEEDAVRAVVISTGNPKDKTSRKIAYLEKYAPEFKQQLAKVRAGEAEPLPRGQRNDFRFVKRVDEADWYSVSSPEGEKIMAEWNVAGPDGKYPAVCIP